MTFLNSIGGTFKKITYNSNLSHYDIELSSGEALNVNSSYQNVFSVFYTGWVYDGPGFPSTANGSDFLTGVGPSVFTPSNLSLYNDDSAASTLDWSLFERIKSLRDSYAPGVSWKISVYGAGGDDRIITGSTKDWVYGGNDSDTIHTGSNNDFLFGGTGTDTLSGGAGNDSFVFNTALGSSNIDFILDFNDGNDTIRLDNAVFKALGASGALNADAFLSSANGIVAVDSEDRIIYNKSSGLLLYDADGVGGSGPMAFAKLQSGLNLTASDFLII